MVGTQRLIFLVLVIAWTIFRVVRYVRVANSKRPGPAVPPPMGSLPQRPAPAPTAPASMASAPTATTSVQSPIEPDGRAGRGRAGLVAAAAILVGGSALIWAILFAVPEFEVVPEIWRLTAGVLATLFLLRAARFAFRRTASPAAQAKGDDRNPIK